MTPAERAAVHALAGAFGRLSLAAELVVQTPPGRARAALVDRMECARQLALAEFSAAQNVLAAENKMCSAERPQPPDLPRAEQTPVPSTTQPVAPGAGDGRAVSPPAPERPAIPPGSTLAAAALLWAQHGSFTAPELAAAGGFRLLSMRTTLSHLTSRGLLRYHAPEQRGTRESGWFERAVSVEALREAQARAGTRDRSAAARKAHAARRASTYARSAAQAASEGPSQPLTDEVLAQYGARRLPVTQARPSAPRPTQAQRVADFFADKPKLPSARPPQLMERGSPCR